MDMARKGSPQLAQRRSCRLKWVKQQARSPVRMRAASPLAGLFSVPGSDAVNAETSSGKV